ncbi:MAG: M24 family metallopeptidase [Elusimicrobiota bacterium]
MVCGASDIYYFTSASCGGVLIAGSGFLELHVPSVNYEKAKNTVSFEGDVISCGSAFPFEYIKKKLKGRRALCDGSSVSYSFGQDLVERCAEEIVFKNNFTAEMRMIKDADEISFIEAACRRAALLMEKINITDWLDKSEASLAGYINSQSWSDGCQGPAFTPVVASGVNSSFPHHIPGPDKIVGPALKIDLGLKFAGYSSDLTRTFILDKFNKHKFSTLIFKKVLEAKSKAAEMLAPGRKCRDVYNAAAAVFEECGLNKYFVHNLGHGLGIDVHEKPTLGPSSEEVLAPGMVLTVEPGLYIPSEGGVRIEDTYLITQEGSRKLTRKSP